MTYNVRTGVKLNLAPLTTGHTWVDGDDVIEMYCTLCGLSIYSIRESSSPMGGGINGVWKSITLGDGFKDTSCSAMLEILELRKSRLPQSHTWNVQNNIDVVCTICGYKIIYNDEPEHDSQHKWESYDTYGTPIPTCEEQVMRKALE